MLFDGPHCLFMLISAVAIAGILVLAYRFLKTDTAKNVFLQLTALAVVLIHVSPIYEDFLRDGEALVPSNVLFPIYPCNLAMWFLLIYAFLPTRKGAAARVLGEFTLYLGTVGGIIGIAANMNYASTPDLGNWSILAGLLSHSVMLLGCFWLLAGGYVRIRVRNTLSVIIGMSLMLLDGFVIIQIFRAAKLDPPNSMFLLGAPLEGFEWLDTATIGVLAVTVTFLFTLAYEALALPAEERTFSKKKSKKEVNKNV